MVEGEDTAMIGIISTFEQEFDAITDRIPGIQHDMKGGQLFHVGQVEHQPFVITASGPGKVAAAATTQQLIDEFEPDRIVHVGLIHKLVSFLNYYDLVLANAIFQSDVMFETFGRTKEETEPATRVYIPDVSLSRKIAEIYDSIVQNKTHDRKLVAGSLLCGDSISEDPTKIRYLVRQHGVVAKDQEAGAVSQVCHKNNIPYAVARMIMGRRVSTDESLMYVCHKEASETYLKLINELLQELAEIENV